MKHLICCCYGLGCFKLSLEIMKQHYLKIHTNKKCKRVVFIVKKSDGRRQVLIIHPLPPLTPSPATIPLQEKFFYSRVISFNKEEITKILLDLATKFESLVKKMRSSPHKHIKSVTRAYQKTNERPIDLKGDNINLNNIQGGNV